MRLTIPKLAATPFPPASRFKSDLLATTSKAQSVNYLREIYGSLVEDWSRQQGSTLYASTEPKVRELLIGVREIAAERESKFAAHDFDTASMYAHSKNWKRATEYLSHALAKIAGILESKTAYGYDIGGQVQEKGGTSGNDRHLWDTGNSPKNDHTQNNPSAMSMDAEAESDYPELAQFKHKRVHWPPRTR